MVQDVLPRHPLGTMPRQLPPVAPLMGAHRHADLVGHERAPPPVAAAWGLARLPDPPHHPRCLRIRIEMRSTVRAPHLSPGRMMHQGTALGLVAPPLRPAAFAQRPCGGVPHAPPPPAEALMLLRWSRQTIGIGPHGAKDRPECAALRPVWVRACQAPQLQPQPQPTRGSAALGQHALQAPARGDPLAALAWLLLQHDPPLGGPPPSDGALDHGLWPGGGRDVLPHVRRRGLADRHDRLSASRRVAAWRPEATAPAWMARGRRPEAPPSASTGGAGRCPEPRADADADDAALVASPRVAVA